MKNPFKKLKVKRRAVTVLAGLHFFGNPSSKLKVVGVTGTNGKTTTATLLYKVAAALGHKAGLISTVENIIAGEKKPATHTTPDPVSLNKLLNEMVKADCEYVFMEVSSHALDQNRVAGIDFTGGIFTNLTHDHLDYHKNLENYFRAKKKFFKMLPRYAFALTNADDEFGKKMTEGIKARKFFYGLSNHADFRGEITNIDFSGVSLKISAGDMAPVHIKSGLLGKFNAYNLLAVWSACHLLQFDAPDGKEGESKLKSILENIKPPRGRFEHFLLSNGALAIVDYAHTPDALENVIMAAKEIKPKDGRLITVFGCGGDRDPFKRPVMGYIGASLSDIPVFTSDNPRSEDPEKIISEMKTDLPPGLLKKSVSLPNRQGAISYAVRISRKGDIILCTGKGHEEYQEVKGVKHHFNDMEELKKAVQQG